MLSVVIEKYLDAITKHKVQKVNTTFGIIQIACTEVRLKDALEQYQNKISKSPDKMSLERDHKQTLETISSAFRSEISTLPEENRNAFMERLNVCTPTCFLI